MQEEDEEAKKDPKKAAAAKKMQAAKGGGGSGKVNMEEVTDNRPRIVSYTNDFAETGIAALKISEDVAEKWTTQFLNVTITNTNRETGEESDEETMKIDISCFLFPQKGDLEFEWKFDKLKTMQIHHLVVKVRSDTPLLSDFLCKKLNPMQINLVAVKDIPFKTEPRYKPIRASFHFVDGKTFITDELPQQKDCRFNHKHVFLTGKHDPVMLKEMLATKIVRVFLHDCEEIVAEDTEINFSQG